MEWRCLQGEGAQTCSHLSLGGVGGGGGGRWPWCSKVGLSESGSALLFVLIETWAAHLVLETGWTSRNEPVSGRERPSVKIQLF